jgi:cell division protein YceG involved in septum cleavage
MLLVDARVVCNDYTVIEGNIIAECIKCHNAESSMVHEEDTKIRADTAEEEEEEGESRPKGMLAFARYFVKKEEEREDKGDKNAGERYNREQYDYDYRNGKSYGYREGNDADDEDDGNEDFDDDVEWKLWTTW